MKVSISMDHRSLLTGLKQVYLGEYNFSDLKLRTKDNMVISAHKLILAARSPYLKSLIEKECSKPEFDGTLELSSVHAKPFLSILHWMYTDELLPDVGKFAKEMAEGALTFELPALIELLDKKMIDYCKPNNMFELFRVAEKFQMNTAMEQLAEYIKININSLLPIRTPKSVMYMNTEFEKPASQPLHIEKEASKTVQLPVQDESFIVKAARYVVTIFVAWIVFAMFSSTPRR